MTTDDNAVVTVASILAALDAGTNVSVTTGTAGGNSQSGDITVASAIGKTAGGEATLTLKARNNIAVNANISSTSNKLNVTLWSDSDNSGAGGITVTGAAINSLGGDVILGGGTDPAADEAVGTTNYGVELNNGDISTGAGSISIRGKGEAANADNYGVYVRNGSVLQSTTGNIDITGTGGAGTNDNIGVFLKDATTSITSADGDIELTGQGGMASGGGNKGIVLWLDPTVTSTGIGGSAGNITLTGTGGDGTVNIHGIHLTARPRISTVDGDILLDGAGGGLSGFSGNYGIYLENATRVESTGATKANAGTITLLGAGDGPGNNGWGMILESSTVTSVAGNIAMTGSSTANGFRAGGIYAQQSTISSTGANADAADITLLGTGSDDGTDTNAGIWLNTNTAISTVDGNIQLHGYRR